MRKMRGVRSERLEPVHECVLAALGPAYEHFYTLD